MFTLVVIVRLRSVLANLIFGLFKIFERLPGGKPNHETAQNDREERQAQPPDALKFVHGLHLPCRRHQCAGRQADCRSTTAAVRNRSRNGLPVHSDNGMVEFTQGRTSTICHGRYLDITLARQTCPATPLLEADQRPLQMAAIFRLAAQFAWRSTGNLSSTVVPPPGVSPIATEPLCVAMT